MDFACPEGTVVRACFDGVIGYLRNKGDGNGAGNRLSLYCRDYRALYFHLKDSGFLCEVGQKVTMGSPLALSGNTGASTGPHLHFELRVLGSDLPTKPEFEELF